MSVKYQEHSVILQMILSLIPIVDLWAAYRIEKLRFWILYFGLLILYYYLIEPVLFNWMDVSSPLVFDNWWNYWDIFNFGIGWIMGPLLMRYFTMKWNKKQFESQDEKIHEPQVSLSDDDPLKILKKRYASGEITQEEFNKIKEDLDE